MIDTHRILFYISLVTITVVLGMVLYFRQSAFLDYYDAAYWKDRMEHSQWVLPVSRRTIGDDGIYAYGGHLLMQGKSIEETYTNKPPVGIYLIGFSIALFNNPNYFSFLTGIAALLVFYLLMKQFIKDSGLALFGTALLAVNPMFLSQLSIPLLDVLHMLFLLLQVLFFVYLITRKTRKQLWALLAGLLLGLFTETKPPLILPIILLLEGGYLLYKRRIKDMFLMGVGFAAGILLPYFRYFQTGHNLLDYLRLHKYMSSVYSEGQNAVHRLALPQAILIGKFPDVSNGSLTNYTEWSLLLPVIMIGSGIRIVKEFLKKKRNHLLLGFGIFVIATILLYMNISSYPRYLLAVLPFSILFFILLVQEYVKGSLRTLFLSGIAVIALVQTYVYLLPTPDANLQRFYRNFSNLMFHDVYHEDIIMTDAVLSNATDFNVSSNRALLDAGIQAVSVKELRRNTFSGENKTVHVAMTYYTRDLGSFTEEKILHLRKVQEDWKIVWDWDLIMKDYQPGYRFETTVSPGRRGSITSDDGTVLVEDTTGYLLSLEPEKIEKAREEALLKQIQLMTGLNSGRVHNAYTENPIPDVLIPIATNFTRWSENDLRTLGSFSGVVLTEQPVRVYGQGIDDGTIQNTDYEECCTRVYSPTSYHGVSGLEKQYEKTLEGSHGGMLILSDSSGNVVRIIREKLPKAGEDVILTQ